MGGKTCANNLQPYEIRDWCVKYNDDQSIDGATLGCVKLNLELEVENISVFCYAIFSIKDEFYLLMRMLSIVI